MRCTLADLASSATWYIHEKFNSVAFLLAMKLHHSGLNCDDQLCSLSGFRSIPFRSASDIQHIFHKEFAPRIANGHFLLRHQTWLLFPVGKKVEVPDRIYACVCPHWYFITPHSMELRTKMSCRASHWDNAQLNSGCLNCSGLFQCMDCPTEFQIDAMNFFEHGVALILTRWLDLGEGWNLLDSKYRSHLRHNENDVMLPFKAGSIKAGYEGADADIASLLTPKYKADMFRLKLQ